MRFAWHPSVPTGGCELSAQPEDYDGSPTPMSLRVEFTPRFSSPGRSAAAAVLAFEPFISGPITFDKAVSPELVNAVVALLRPRVVWPGPLELHPRAIPTATGSFFMEPVDTHVAPSLSTSERQPRLLLISSGAEFGHTFGPGFVVLPTNAHLLAPDSPLALRRLLPHLATVVLVAEDLGVGIIILPSDVVRDDLFFATAELLRTVGLRLTVQ